MKNVDPKAHQRILEDAYDFMKEHEQEFEALCSKLAEVVNGKSLSMGILAIQTVLSSLMASDDCDKDDLFYRVMVLIYSNLHHPDGGNFNIINKAMLN
jgi:hypothetical protein